MEMNTQLTLNEAGSLILGAGLVKMEDLTTGLILIGVGALLKISVAILQSRNIVVGGQS